MNVFFDAARNLPGHWMKGSLLDYLGNYCVIGHVREATLAENHGVCDYNIVEHIDFLDEVVHEHYPQYGGAAYFNDAPDTTEEMVVEMLEKAGARWDEHV